MQMSVTRKGGRKLRQMYCKFYEQTIRVLNVIISRFKIKENLRVCKGTSGYCVDIQTSSYSKGSITGFPQNGNQIYHWRLKKIIWLRSTVVRRQRIGNSRLCMCLHVHLCTRKGQLPHVLLHPPAHLVMATGSTGTPALKGRLIRAGDFYQCGKVSHWFFIQDSACQY